MNSVTPLLELKCIFYEIKNKTILDNINFAVNYGELIGISGESGSGKTTLGNIISGIITPTSGKKLFEGKEFSGIEENHNIQFLFQNYSATHDPLQKIKKSFEELFQLTDLPKNNNLQNAIKILEKVRLDSKVLELYPYQLSGGQQQRLALAKILVFKPKLIILDEPFASQDVIAQAELISLIKEINKTENISFLIISHDISILKNLCSKIIVLYSGKIMEIIESKNLHERARHPYTKFLLDNFSTFNYKHTTTNKLIADESGCVFIKYCNYAKEVCQNEVKEFQILNEMVKCNFPLEKNG
ncbi:MAG: ATP-binding cassette domain-containing protein [Ignavibacteria bacterium]|nr:ATP-binding cassette domain-containing protein [Ignavibacteria bacterium]